VSDTTDPTTAATTGAAPATSADTGSHGADAQMIDVRTGGHVPDTVANAAATPDK